MATFTLRNVQANAALDVLFRTLQTMFTITVTAGPGGTVTPSGAVEVAQGADQVFVITPDAGMVVDKVLLNGVEQPLDPV